jgi:hypothetical protein
MKIATGRVLDRLPAEEPCLGALFTSYSFDPAFFEDHILRAVLRLTSDPVEQAERYHHEARHVLQRTPVVAIVDAAERRPGRRLPFDLLEVSDVVFHPKAALLLYQERARFLIGSGNLTFSGYGGNTELFLCVDLAYQDPADAALLNTFDEHLGRIRELVRQPGTQLALFREELRRRLPITQPDSRVGSIALLDSTKGPILDQLAALLPADAVIHSLGMLAPFYERDDAADLDETSVFGALAHRVAEDAALDVGVAWDNPQVHAAGASQLHDGLGRLWTWAYDDQGTRVIEHLVPASIGPNTLSYLDEAGRTRRWPLDEVLEAIEQRTLWMQPPPVVFAPRNTLAAATRRYAEVRVWLHPATRLIDGRPVHRPLHAKLLVVSFRSKRSHGTLVLMGSPNMSRRALLLGAGAGQGNVELALAFRLNASLSLRDFVPELIHAPASAFDLREREFPELGRNHALAIDQATHDPLDRSLLVTWSDEASALPAWRLTYDGQELARSDAAPTSPLRIEDFVLRPATAEVVLHVGDREYPAPILVTDLVHLPAAPAGPRVGLDELLMLLGRRIGTERAVQIAERRASGRDDDDDLSSFFGETFSPTDVFRAWWSVAEDLADPNLSVPAFRLRLEGALGVGAAWSCMLEAMRGQESLPAEEVWFYGAELLRTLAEVELPQAADRDAKAQVLSTFCARVRSDLGTIAFDTDTRPWAKRIFAFYTETKA